MNGEAQQIYTWWLDSTSIFLRYFILAGGGYLIFYIWKQNSFSSLKIQKKLPSDNVIIKEIFHSIITLMIYCITSWTIFTLKKSGLTKIYLEIHQFTYSYFILSVIIMVVLHDTYFYWTHRFMHSPAIFKIVHKTHHLSDNPTPWAAFSFHPLEAILSVGIIPIIVFSIPCHPFALFSFLTFMTIMNVMGHLGYEIFPKGFINSSIGKWQNTSTNHNIHHQESKYNFGLYFTFWDRIMGTYRTQ